MNGYKIKCLIISTVSIFISHITIGQAPSWNMSQRFGAIANDVSKSISVDAVGNQIIGGSFESNSISFGSILLSKVGGKDIYVAKLSQSGVIVWAKSAGGSGVDEVTSVSTDASNNIIVAGYFNSNTISFGSTILNNKGGTDVFVVKYDPNGNILWAVSAGGAGNDEANSVCTDLSGNVYVTGFYESSTVSFNSETLTNKGGKDIFILKFNNNGVPVSSRTYGDAGNDWGVFLRRNSLNQIFVTGNFVSSTIRFDSFVLNNSNMAGLTEDIFAVKLDSSLKVLWSNSEGGTLNDILFGATVDSKNNLIVVGYFYNSTLQFGSYSLTNAGGNKMFIGKYEDNGNVSWARTVGWIGGNNYANCVTADSFGDLLVAGRYEANPLIFGSWALPNIGGQDIFVVKYNASGDVQWARSAGGSGDDIVTSAATDAQDKFLITGYFNSASIPFGNSTVTSAGGNDIFIGLLNNNTSNNTPSDCSTFNFNPFPSNIYTSLDSTKLDAGSGFTRIRWSSGDTTPSIFVKSTGGYRVTVTNAAGCTGTDSIFVQFRDTVGLHVSTVNAVCNKSVDVPIRVTAFRNMISMQGSINWNAAELRFDSIASYGPTALGLNAANFSTTKVPNGQLTFSWNDPAGTGQTLADSTALITLRFTALGTTVRSVPVTVTGNPTPLEFYDAALVKKSSVQTAGAVNITCEFTISGKVLTPADKGVKNVTVTLTGGSSPLTAVTDSAGNYSFKILPGTYTLTPSKNYEQFKTNGISTIDLVFIQAHILQRSPFTSAYKMFASDANNSSSVTTADILSIRRLILGSDTTLPDNRIWAFVDGGQAFANPTAPFPFSSIKTFTNQSTDVSHTFRGIKIGDVNYDRNPLLDQAPSGDTLRLFGEWTDTEDGYVTLKVKSRAVSGLLGWQSTLRWDAKQLQLQLATGLINNLGIGERWKDEGYLTLSWNDPRAEGLSFTEGSTWMELKFRKTSALQRAGIGMTEEKLGMEAFNGNYQSMGVKMEPVELKGNSLNGMMRVYPNPASRLVNVEWKSARTGLGLIRLVDAQGRVVYQREASVVQGLNKARIEVPVGLASGSFVVQVLMGEDVNTASVLIGK